MKRILALMLTITLLAVGCGGDDEGDETTTMASDTTSAPETTQEPETTEVPETTTTSPTTTTTAPPGDSGVHFGCVVATDLVRVDPGFLIDELSADLAELVTELDANDLVGRLGLGADPSVTNAVATVLTEDKYLALSGVTTIDGLADFIAQTGAEPVYAAAYEGHWGMEPGGDAYQPLQSVPQAVNQLVDPLEDPYDVSSAQGPVVGIVDSGFPLSRYQGLAVGITAADAGDVDISHGSFVTSIIRQLAPTAEVYGAKASVASEAFVSATGIFLERVEVGDPKAEFKAPDGSIFVLSDEVAVKIAIQRIIDAASAADAGPVAALNLSLGTYACSEGVGVPPPTIVQSKIELVAANGSVFAAAGNESYPLDHPTPAVQVSGVPVQLEPEDFYPAAFGNVVGVGALDADGMIVVWNEGGDRERYDPLVVQATAYWYNDLYRGIDMVGIGNGAPGVWSGSSFATAVATGLAVGNATAAACPVGLAVASRDDTGAVASVSPCPSGSN